MSTEEGGSHVVYLVFLSVSLSHRLLRVSEWIFMKVDRVVGYDPRIYGFGFGDNPDHSLDTGFLDVINLLHIFFINLLQIIVSQSVCLLYLLITDAHMVVGKAHIFYPVVYSFLHICHAIRGRLATHLAEMMLTYCQKNFLVMLIALECLCGSNQLLSTITDSSLDQEGTGTVERGWRWYG